MRHFEKFVQQIKKIFGINYHKMELDRGSKLTVVFVGGTRHLEIVDGPFWISTSYFYTSKMPGSQHKTLPTHVLNLQTCTTKIDWKKLRAIQNFKYLIAARKLKQLDGKMKNMFVGADNMSCIFDLNNMFNILLWIFSILNLEIQKTNKYV